MVWVADDLGAWLVAVLADAGRKKLTGMILGDEVDRALGQAATAAVQATARELRPGDADGAEGVARVISEVFAAAAAAGGPGGRGTVLESLQAGIAAQLAVLEDRELTGAGESSAEVLEIGAGVLAQRLTGRLLDEIVFRGARGGPLFPLAVQLNADVTHLQDRQSRDALDQLGADILAAVARIGQPVAAVPVALSQLPPAVRGFTGRDAAMGVLAGLLDPAGPAGRVAVSAVAGLAGVGKTTLAVEAGHASRARGWFRGGVLFLDLHGYDDQPVEPAQALDALLRALGIPAERIPPTADERGGLYRSALAQMAEPVLVIADNASSEAQVRPLLPGAGPHAVLVTSRHTLAGLGARLVDLTVLADSDAISMLDEALRTARPADDRITADPRAAGRLAGACGGLPLALQITAALLTADPSLAAAELADELGEEQGRLARLAYHDGTGTGTRSVAAALELSYRRLDDTAARLFRLLSASPGPDISLAAAAVLAGLPVGQTRRQLADLGRAHLAEPAPGAAGRWRMHDLVRLYARQLSDTDASADGRELAISRLLDWFLGTAAAADAHLRALPGAAVPQEFAGREEALAWLDAERPALIAAVTLAASTGRNEIAMRLPNRLAEYFGWRRRFDDRLATATISLDAARRLGDRANEAAALNNRALALRNLRQFEEAITCHQQDLAIRRETGDRHGEGKALGNLGIALQEVRRFDEAITADKQAAVIYSEAGDRRHEASALSNLGLALRKMRRFDEAITACQDSAAIYRQARDRRHEGMALDNLGLALRHGGRLAEAITAHQDAVAIHRTTGNRHGEGMALNNLGQALQEEQRFDQAITAHKDAVAIYRETGDRHREGMALNNLGMALRGLRRYAEAIIAHQDAAAIFGETGDRHRENMALENLDSVRAEQSA